MDQEPAWINDPSVLWRNWTKVLPRQGMNQTELANTLARLGLLGGGTLSLVFGSVTFLGLGMLLVLISSQMLRTPQTKPRKSRRKRRTINVTPQMDQLEFPQETPSPSTLPGASASLRDANASAPSGAGGWNDFFGGPGSAPLSTGGHVSRSQSEIEQVMGEFGTGEGMVDSNLVPPSAVTEFQAGGYTLRSPFPRPITGGPCSDGGSPSTIVRNPDGSIMHGFDASAPYQAGFPTAFGPTPTAIPPSPAQFVRNVPGRENAQQQAIAAATPGQYQAGSEGGAVTWGAFMSDGGNTSTPVTPPVPSGTVGSNFTTAEYTPRNLAQAGAPLTPPSAQGCFPADANNVLGNVPLGLNNVARPPLCSAVDPRCDSEKFVDGLFESPASQAAGYTFFPQPNQDLVEARDNFQKFVVEDGQTHFKDKWSGQENVGIYNITDHASDQLGW